MPDGATIRATISGQDTLDTLRRALAMAEELMALGFDVELTGDLFVSARVTPRPEVVNLPPDATPADVDRIRAARDA